jgi:hypothetical protein
MAFPYNLSRLCLEGIHANTAPYDANLTAPERLHVDGLSFTGGLVTIYASTTNLTADR